MVNIRCSMLACVVVLASTGGCAKRDGATTRRSAPANASVAADINQPVVDQTGVLARTDVDHLSQRLLLLRERTGAQMAVLLVATTGDEPIEDYSMRVAEAWRGGTEGRDDGLLLTMAMQDRRMRLEVGTGLEGDITDSEALHIIDGMKEDLRAGATARAIDGVIERVGRELPRTHPSLLDGGFLQRPGSGTLVGLPFSMAALRCVLVFLMVARPPRRLTAWLGFAAALAVIGGAISWLYAGLGGLAQTEPLAFWGSVAPLLLALWPVDSATRKLRNPPARWFSLGMASVVAMVVTTGGAGVWLGSPDAPVLLLVGGLFVVVILPIFLGAAGGGSGGGNDPPSHGGSGGSGGASSSGGSSYDGGGGGFSGGGASSSW